MTTMFICRRGTAAKPGIPQRQVADFNRKHPIGTPVLFWRGSRPIDDSGGTLGTTRDVASVLGGHTAVVWLKDVAGCVALSHVRALSAAEATRYA